MSRLDPSLLLGLLAIVACSRVDDAAVADETGIPDPSLVSAGASGPSSDESGPSESGPAASSESDGGSSESESETDDDLETGGELACVSNTFAARNSNEVVLCSATDEPLLARFAVPQGPPPFDGWPGVILLHGSSGLFRREPQDQGCSELLHGRFADWEQLLTDRGYAVVMPDSFGSRGYCEWDDAPPGADDEHERLIMRAHDVAGAAAWLCDDPRIDCTRLGLLGFSNGATVALLMMHEDLGDAADPRLQALVSPIFAVGAAYYPGCGLDSELSNQLDPAQIDRYFFPTGPTWVPHAREDHLAKRCEELRDPQVDVIAEQRGIEDDLFELEIYPGAKHGFDGWDEGDPVADRKARDAAETHTLLVLYGALRP